MVSKKIRKMGYIVNICVILFNNYTRYGFLLQYPQVNINNILTILLESYLSLRKKLLSDNNKTGIEGSFSIYIIIHND